MPIHHLLPGTPRTDTPEHLPEPPAPAQDVPTVHGCGSPEDATRRQARHDSLLDSILGDNWTASLESAAEAWDAGHVNDKLQPAYPVSGADNKDDADGGDDDDDYELPRQRSATRGAPPLRTADDALARFEREQAKGDRRNQVHGPYGDDGDDGDDGDGDDGDDVDDGGGDDDGDDGDGDEEGPQLPFLGEESYLLTKGLPAVVEALQNNQTAADDLAEVFPAIMEAISANQTAGDDLTKGFPAITRSIAQKMQAVLDRLANGTLRIRADGHDEL